MRNPRTIARIQRYDPVQLDSMRSKERAVLPCGCCLYFGMHVATREVTVSPQPCMVPHERLTNRAVALVCEELNLPATTGRQLPKDYMERVRDALSRAAQEVLSSRDRLTTSDT